MNFVTNFWRGCAELFSKKPKHDYKCPHGVDLRALYPCLACKRIQREELRKQSDDI